MRRGVGALLTALMLLALLAVPASAAWTWQRLSNNAGWSGVPAIAVSGSNVHMVWQDSTLGSNFEIFYKGSTNNGATWSWQRLSNNAGWSGVPAIAVSGSNVHVVWQDGTLGNFEIFYKRSTDNGNTWAWQRLSSNAGESRAPAITVWGSDVHVVWQDDTLGNYEIFYKRSTDNGNTWAWQRLSSNAGSSVDPAIAVNGSNVHVVWWDDTLTGWPSTEIFYKRSTDNGNTWSWQRLSYNGQGSYDPAIAVSGSNVHVVWDDVTFGSNEIFYKRSTDNGNTWSWQRLSNNAGISMDPAIAVSGSNVHMVWEDYTLDSNYEIFYKGSTNSGATWSWQRLSNNSGISWVPAVAVSGSNVHVVWEDDTLGPAFTPEIFYKRGP